MAGQTNRAAGMEYAPQASVPVPRAASEASPDSGAAAPDTQHRMHWRSDMSIPDLEHVVRQLTARGVRVLEGDEATPEMALGIIREQRRRHAHEPRTKALGAVSARLADGLAADTDVAADDIARVLAAVSTRLGALAIGHGVPGRVLCELMGFAADDLAQRAKEQQRVPGTP